MHLSLLTSLALLARAASAQDLTIQTSIPSSLVDPSSTPCLEVCVVEPCSACPTSSDAPMSIPQGETPISTPLTNPLTDPPAPSVAPTIQTSTGTESGTPEMSVPSGETPITTPTSGMASAPAGTSSRATSATGSGSGSGTTSVSVSTVAPPAQTSPNVGVRVGAGGMICGVVMVVVGLLG